MVPVLLKLKLLLQSWKSKSPGSDQIPAEQIQAGGEALLFAIHKLVTYIWNKEEMPIWNKEEMPDQGKESIIIMTGRL
jgi:hypothetical protein